MKRVRSAVLILGCLAMGGCLSAKNPYDPKKPIDKMDKTELCDYYGVYLSNPDLMEQDRKTATDKKRSMGCPA